MLLPIILAATAFSAPPARLSAVAAVASPQRTLRVDTPLSATGASAAAVQRSVVVTDMDETVHKNALNRTEFWPAV